jgi:hypothetical protein
MEERRRIFLVHSERKPKQVVSPRNHYPSRAIEDGIYEDVWLHLLVLADSFVDAYVDIDRLRRRQNCNWISNLHWLDHRSNVVAASGRLILETGEEIQKNDCIDDCKFEDGTDLSTYGVGKVIHSLKKKQMAARNFYHPRNNRR